jgi:hypothetical protein
VSPKPSDLVAIQVFERRAELLGEPRLAWCGVRIVLYAVLDVARVVADSQEAGDVQGEVEGATRDVIE